MNIKTGTRIPLCSEMWPTMWTILCLALWDTEEIPRNQHWQSQPLRTLASWFCCYQFRVCSFNNSPPLLFNIGGSKQCWPRGSVRFFLWFLLFLGFFTDQVFTQLVSIPLLNAAEAGHVEDVRLLLDHGADISQRNYYGLTGLTIFFFLCRPFCSRWAGIRMYVYSFASS
jgi:hypothetical protein